METRLFAVISILVFTVGLGKSATASRDGEEWTPLMRAAEEFGQAENIRMLLDADVNVNMTDEHGKTAVMKAVRGTHLNNTAAILLRCSII